MVEMNQIIINSMKYALCHIQFNDHYSKYWSIMIRIDPVSYIVISHIHVILRDNVDGSHCFYGGGGVK